MSTLFPPILEKRYAQYPRRYLNEYHVDSRTKKPDAKGSCATLTSAKVHSLKAIELGYCSTVRIFDHMIGQYVCTYKKNHKGNEITRHEGYLK